MKIFGYEIKRSIKPSGEVINDGDCSCGDALLFGSLRGDYAAMNLSTVFRCVDLISDSVAMLPIRVQKQSDNCQVDAESHSLNTIFKSGYANQLTKYHFVKLLIKDVLLKGNGYALIERATDGTVTGLRYVEPGDMNVYFNKSRNSSVYYTCNLIPNKKIEPCNVIHLRRYTTDGVNGKSVLSYATRTVKLASSGENHATNVYQHGCNLSGVISVDGTLNKQQRQGIKEVWNQSMSNGGDGIAVIPGNMHFQQVTITPADAQLLESRLFQVDEICRFFGVSPILVGELSHTQYNSLEAAQQEFILHTLSGYITMVQEEFTKKLFKPSEYGYSINLDEAAILKTDKTALANYYSSMLKSGILCINEVRKEMGMNEIEGGDKHVIPFTDINQNTLNGNDNNNGNGGDSGDSLPNKQ